MHNDFLLTASPEESLDFATTQSLTPELIDQAKNHSEQELLILLRETRFHINQNLSWKERHTQSYCNFQYLLSRYPITAEDVLQKSERFLALHELLAMVDGTLMTILTIHFNLCLGTLLQSERTKKEHAALIEDLLKGKIVGTFLATELGYGNNVVSLQTTARLDRNKQKFIITCPTPEAIKFMPNTTYVGIKKVSVVLARLIIDEEDKGVFPFIIPLYDEFGKPTPGVEIIPLTSKPGYDLDNAMTRFVNCHIPLKNIVLDNQTTLTEQFKIEGPAISLRKRFLNSMDRVQAGKLVLSVSMARGSALVLKIASDYLHSKKTFAPGEKDVPIANYIHIQNFLATSLCKSLACHALFESTLASSQSNNDLATLKVVSTQLAHNVLFNVREKIGCHGLFSENNVITFLNQLPGVVTAEGDNEVILIRMGRDLLNLEKPFKLIQRMILGLFRRDHVSLLQKAKDRLTLRLVISSYVQFHFKKATLFKTWNLAVADIILLSTTESYIQSLKSLNEFTSIHITDSALQNAVSTVYGADVINTLKCKGLKLNDIKSRHLQNAHEVIYQNREQIFRILKPPTCLSRSPLLGNFVKNYSAAFDGYQS